MGADPAAVRARVDILLRADKSNEPATIRAMQQLFSMCRSKTKEHLANQAAAADAGGVRALLRLVDVGSLKQRMWALNTLGRLCFDHPENAAEVCRSRAIEVSVANVLGREPSRLPSYKANKIDVGLALDSHDSARVKDKSAYLLGNLAARPASHPRLLESGAASAAVAVLNALNRAREENVPEHEIHAAFVARSVGLLTNLSVHEPSRAAVRAAGALPALERVAREEGHNKHRPASAAIASANLCSDDNAVNVPRLEPMPKTVLEYVVKALSSAVKREKYMGNVYYTPWKVALGVRNLAAMHPLNLSRLSGAIRPLIDGLSFDELSRHHCSLALYEICVGHPDFEHHLLMHSEVDRAHPQRFNPAKVIAPLIASTQRVAWACSILNVSSTVGHASATHILSHDVVELVAERVTANHVANSVVQRQLTARLKKYGRRDGECGLRQHRDRAGDDSDSEGSDEEIIDKAC